VPSAVTTVDVAAIVDASAAVEPIASPAVAISPIRPGTYAEEDAVVKVAGTVVAVGGAGVGIIIVITPRACGRRSTNGDSNLRATDRNADTDLRASRCRRECQTG
jgi:hypothetical protein